MSDDLKATLRARAVSATYPTAPAEPTRVRGFSFTVPGQPVPKERAGRVGYIDKRTGKPRARSFNPERTSDYEEKVAKYAQAAGVKLLRGRVGIRILFFRADYRRADLENLQKSVWDALTGIAYEDDSQIHQSAEVKEYDKENPRCEVRVWEIAEVALEPVPARDWVDELWKPGKQPKPGRPK